MGGLPDERVLAALEELLGWPAIARSPQLARFLSYIVTCKLRGEESGIKAYAIAVDVFGRPSTFDPQSDPIVRVQARRLRTLLDQFYDDGLGRTGVQIQLPVGRYIPEFVSLDASGVPPAAVNNTALGPATAARDGTSSPLRAPFLVPGRREARGRVLRQAAGGALLVVALGIIALPFVRPPETGPPPAAAPGLPTVLVGAFGNLTGVADLDEFGMHLAEGVAVALEPFEDLRVERAPLSGAVPAAHPEQTYVIGGLINPAPQGIEVTAVLTGSSGETLWTGRFARPVPTGVGEADVVTAFVRALVQEIAPFRGPIHHRGRGWLDEQPRPLSAVNEYVCLLTYRIARESGSSSHISDALACNETLRAQQPEQPAALSASAWLDMRAALTRRLLGDDLADMLAVPLERAQRAASLAPNSSVAHEHVGAILNWQDALADARREFVDALRLNPLNTDARANYAIVLARAGEWALSRRQAELAIDDTPYPSPWYYYPIAIEAFRTGDFERALEAGLEATRFEGDQIAGLVVIAAAARLARTDQVEALLPRAMGSEALRRTGIRPWLEMQLLDPQTADALTAALLDAGVPENALTGPF